MIKICRSDLKSSRAKNVYLNSGIALIGQILQILAGFIVRRMFLLYLGKNYLGYESVFANILQMLNTADIGISVAITAFLYQPLARQDNDAITALMYLYKRIYQVIGAIVLVFGIGVSFLLPILIPDADCSAAMLRVYFFVSLFGTVFTYYLAYKRTLLLADQKSYLVMLIDTIVYLAASLCQIAILRWQPDYLLYLLTVIARILISNAIIAFGCNKLYPNLKQSVNKTDFELYKTRVTTYVKDLFVAKIGGYIFNSTDNLVLSIFRGSILAGYLSNYTMITQQVNNLVGQILSSVQATYGNFITVTKDMVQQRKMTDTYLMVNAFIGTFCMLCVMFLIQPFVQIFFGKIYLLENTTVLWLSINLMLAIILQLPTQIFTVYRLYHYDRPIVAVSAILNIIISVLLVQKIGIDGVLIGTFITSLVYLFSRFYIIASCVYHISYWHYLIKFLRYFSVAIVCVIIMYMATSQTTSTTLIAMAMKSIVTVLLAAILPLCILNLTPEFRHITEIMVPPKWKIFCSKWVIWGASVILLITMGVIGSLGASKMQAGEGSKSAERTDAYVLEKQETAEKVFHLSFDDVINVFRDLTINESNYNSLFENSTLGWLKELHEKYGIVVSCFVYYRDGDFCLENCTTKFKTEFENNSD